MGNGLNAQRILDGIKQSNDELKQILITKFGSQHQSLANEPTGVVHNTFLNTGTSTMTRPTTVNTQDVPLLSSDDGIWGHFWGNKIRLLPESFVFPHKKTLLSLWLSWHVPDVSRKVCPYKILKTSDVMHMKRGQNKLLEMKMVIEVLVSKIKEHDGWYNRYLRGIKNIHELSEIFHAFKDVYKNILNVKRKARFGQLCWETFVRDARLIKHNLVPSYTFHPPPFRAQQTIDQDLSPTTPPRTRRSSNPVTITQEEEQEVQNNNGITLQGRLLQQTPPTTPHDENSNRNESSNSITSNTRQPPSPHNTSPHNNESKSNESSNTITSNITLTKSAKRAIIHQRTRQSNLITPTRRNRNSTATRYLKKRTPIKRSKPTKKPIKSRTTYVKKKSSIQEEKGNSFENTFNLNEGVLNKPSKEEMKLNELGHFMPVMCRKCSSMPTMHRCSYEISNGVPHKGKLICGLPICAICCANMNLEGIYRCERHANKDESRDI